MQQQQLLRRRLNDHLLKFRFVLAIVVANFVVSCTPSDQDLVEKADRATLEQKSQLAKYLYLQVIQGGKRRNEARAQALKGLTELSMNQLFDYAQAVAALEKLIEEYENEPFYRKEAPAWRLKAAKLALDNLENPERADQILRPLLKTSKEEDLDIPFQIEFGEIAFAKRDYKEAEKLFKMAFARAEKARDCNSLKSLQLKVIQIYSISKSCDKAFEWIDKKLPSGCIQDQFSLGVERGNCLEISGDPQAAIQVFEKMIKEDPKNSRLHLFMEGIKQRQRDKAKR